MDLILVQGYNIFFKQYWYRDTTFFLNDTGTGIQHFFKNLGYDTLGISVLITYAIYSIYIFYI